MRFDVNQTFKKVSLSVLFICISAAALSAQTYRYGMFKNDGGSEMVTVFDVSEELPVEAVDGFYILPLNSSTERNAAESDYRNIQANYYDGSLQLAYLDLTNPESPDYRFLYSWNDFMSYVRGEK